MSLPIDQLLRKREAEILDRWEERLRRSGLDLRTGTPDQRRARHREALQGALAALERRDGAPAALPFAIGMARVELRRPGEPRNQADTVLSLLLGREVLRDLLAAQVPADELPALVGDLDAAFNQVVSLYGQTSCTMCLARQEESRVKVERHLESVLESSQDAIVLCDLECSIEHWNPGAEAVFGYPAAEMRGSSLARLLPGGGWPAGVREALVEELRAHGHVRQPELELVRRDHTHFWVDASYTLVRESSGEPLGVWVLFRDVTEQRRVLDDRLHAERLALVGLMSAKFAHEIRNPLTSILINLDLLRDSLRLRGDLEAGSSEDEDTLGSIAEEVNRIQNVVQDYLRFGRKGQLSRVPVPFDELLRRHLVLLEPEFVQRGLELDLRLAAGEAVVDADEDQLWQAVLNLVRNGMEAMAPGGRLTVASALDDGHIRCSIEDTGVGMSPEVIEQMFRPFFSTKRGGTGLGMPLVRQVLAEHGAALECHSQPGVGTRFDFTLPVVTTHVD